MAIRYPHLQHCDFLKCQQLFAQQHSVISDAFHMYPCLLHVRFISSSFFVQNTVLIETKAPSTSTFGNTPPQMTSIITAATTTAATITVTGMHVGTDSQQGVTIITDICCKKLVFSKQIKRITELNSLAQCNLKCCHHYCS